MLSRWSHWNDWFRPSSFYGADFENTIRSLDRLRREMDHLFSEYETGIGGTSRTPATPPWPWVSLSDVGSALKVQALLPGMSEKDLDISVTANTLTLRGERQADAPEGYSVHRKERRSYRFERSYQLPFKVDPDGCEAIMRHGVLTLTLAKAAEAQPKQIAVKSA